MAVPLMEQHLIPVYAHTPAARPGAECALNFRRPHPVRPFRPAKAEDRVTDVKSRGSPHDYPEQQGQRQIPQHFSSPAQGGKFDRFHSAPSFF